MAIAITKELGSNSLHSDVYPGLIPLPISLYKVNSDDIDDGGKVDGSNLPACLTDGDALSQLWSRGSRSGQVQPSLASGATLRKEKLLAAEACSPKDPEGSRRVVNGTAENPENDVLVQNTVKPADPLVAGRVLRKRNTVPGQNAEEKCSTESDRVSVSERLLRSCRVVNEIAEAPNVKALPSETTKSVIPGSGGRVKRKRGLEKTSVPSDKVSVSASPRRSCRLSNVTTEAAVNEAVQVDVIKSASPVSEGRVLRKRNVVPDQQLQGRNTAEFDEEETMATWRSRRRKVQ